DRELGANAQQLLRGLGLVRAKFLLKVLQLTERITTVAQVVESVLKPAVTHVCHFILLRSRALCSVTRRQPTGPTRVVRSSGSPSAPCALRCWPWVAASAKR